MNKYFVRFFASAEEYNTDKCSKKCSTCQEVYEAYLEFKFDTLDEALQFTKLVLFIPSSFAFSIISDIIFILLLLRHTLTMHWLLLFLLLLFRYGLPAFVISKQYLL